MLLDESFVSCRTLLLLLPVRFSQFSNGMSISSFTGSEPSRKNKASRNSSDNGVFSNEGLDHDPTSLKTDPDSPFFIKSYSLGARPPPKPDESKRKSFSLRKIFARSIPDPDILIGSVQKISSSASDLTGAFPICTRSSKESKNVSRPALHMALLLSECKFRYLMTMERSTNSHCGCLLFEQECCLEYH